jgi:hypothetical protein
MGSTNPGIFGQNPFSDVPYSSFNPNQIMGLNSSGGNPPTPGGSNQWMSYPTMPNPTQASGTNTPGKVPPSNPSTIFPASISLRPDGSGPTGTPGSELSLGGSTRTTPTFDPQFTAMFYSWLQSQLGQGATPFNLSAILPSSGQATAPGQLTAPNNQILQQLMSMFTGGPTTIPGGAGLQEMSQTGDPISGLPEWQAMIEAQKRNIGQKEANLKENFAFAGNMASSPFGTAMSDFQSQSALDQNALLAQLEQQSMESAMGRKAGAQQFLSGEAGQIGEYLQGLDQQSIQNMYQEFIRTRPEYSPLLQMMFGGATSSPGTTNIGASSNMGGIASLLGAGASGLAQLLPLLGLCWVAEVLYGVDDERTHSIRYWLNNDEQLDEDWGEFKSAYQRYGKKIAEVAANSPSLRAKLLPVFERALVKAKAFVIERTQEAAYAK